MEVFTVASTSAANTLPVELIKFEVIPVSERVFLEWETESEVNVSHFIVERSTDGLNFEKIDFVSSKGGTSTSAKYSVKDLSPYYGWNYYRLKMVDIDDSFEYSHIEVVKININSSTIVYPNPVKQVLLIQDTEWIEDDLRIEIFNKNAIKIFEQTTSLDGSPFPIATDDRNLFPAGYYMLRITGKQGSKVVKFIKAE